MKVRATVACLFLSAALTACNNSPQNQERVREDTARTTATLKSDAKAISQGIRDGLREKTPSTSDLVDINSADKAQLETLPGIDGTLADRIIAHRPYTSSSELKSKHVLTAAEYDRVAPKIRTRH